MSICDACQVRAERPCTYEAKTRELFDILIKPLRYVAYRYGYALAVHGSLKTDIDLIAVPWRESACHPESVAEAIRACAEQIIGICVVRDVDKDRLPEKKPNGRLAWSFYLGPPDYHPGVPYIDISVMPSVDKLEAERLELVNSLAAAQDRVRELEAAISIPPIKLPVTLCTMEVR